MQTGHGCFHWNELVSLDVAAAKKFYSEVLGWTYEDVPMPDGTVYVVCKSGDDTVGGMFEATPEMVPSGQDHWLSYVEVDDVDQRVKAVENAGGMILRAPFDVEMAGRIAIVKQGGTGSAIGLIKPNSA